MSSEPEDDKILSYNDTVLMKSDIDLLVGPFFLNDRIIDFYFSYLASTYPASDVLLVSASVAFWIKECRDASTLNDFLQPLELPEMNLIIFPINDNTVVDEAEGGSHWSLLVFYRNANVFVHHDSLSGINSSDARQVYRAVLPYTESDDAKYVDFPNMPTQENGYDCGLYVTAISHVICKWYGKEEPKDMKELWFSTVREKITPSRVSQMRMDILVLVRRLVAKKKQ